MTASSFASRRRIRSSIAPAPKSFSTAWMHMTFARWRMSSASVHRLLRRALLACITVCAGGFAGCQQDMAHQPKQRPLSPTDFFGDGRSERALVEGTVARGSVEQDAFAIPKDSDAFPLAVTPQLLPRRRGRVDIYCGVCHGKLGAATGM